MNKLLISITIGIIFLIPLFVISTSENDALDILFAIIENAHTMQESELDVLVPMAQDIVVAYLSNESFSNASAKPGPITGMTVDEIVSNATIQINHTIQFWCGDSDGGLNINTWGYVNSSSGFYQDSCIDFNTIKEFYCADISVRSETIDCSFCNSSVNECI